MFLSCASVGVSSDFVFRLMHRPLVWVGRIQQRFTAEREDTEIAVEDRLSTGRLSQEKPTEGAMMHVQYGLYYCSTWSGNCVQMNTRALAHALVGKHRLLGLGGVDIEEHIHAMLALLKALCQVRNFLFLLP